MAAAADSVGETTVRQDDDVEMVAPVASEHFVPKLSLEAIPSLSRADVPRVLEAVDSNLPHETPEYEGHGFSALQQHVLFFDFDNDGIIYPWETFRGFRAIGFNLLVSLLAIVIINGALSYLTLDSWIPSLWFPIYVKNIHKSKHGSDTEVYDTEGRFVPEKFENLFSKFAKSDRNRLHFDEVLALTNANMKAYDLIGWMAAKLEWLFAYLLVRDDDGCVSKEHIRGIYDGSLFYTMANRHQSKMHKPKEF